MRKNWKLLRLRGISLLFSGVCLFGGLGGCFQQARDSCTFDWGTGTWDCSGVIDISDI